MVQGGKKGRGPQAGRTARSTSRGTVAVSTVRAPKTAPRARPRHPSRLLWLPAASISATRIDAHPANAHPATDCLHYCMPGPVDAWTHALFHLLATKPLN